MPENFDLLFPISTIIDGDMTATMHDEDMDENNVLDANRYSSIMVHWHLEKPLAFFLPPQSQWRVTAHFEQIGGGEGPVILSVVIPYGAGQPPRFWHAQIPIPPGTLTAAPYKVVVLLDYEWPADTPTRMAAFVEIPMVRYH